MYYELGSIGSMVYESNRLAAEGRHDKQGFHEKPIKLLEDQ